jgi:hypothetical protein
MQVRMEATPDEGGREGRGKGEIPQDSLPMGALTMLRLIVTTSTSIFLRAGKAIGFSALWSIYISTAS